MPKQRFGLGTRLKGGVFAVVRLGLTVGVLVWAASTVRFVRTAAHAPSVVSRLNAGGAHPEIVFTAASGQIVSYPQGGMIADYRAGQRVGVLYNPRRPSESPCLNTWPALWLDKVMLLLMGLLFCGIGGWLALGREEAEPPALT